MARADGEEGRLCAHDGRHQLSPVEVAVLDEAVFLSGSAVTRCPDTRLHSLLYLLHVLAVICVGERTYLCLVKLEVVNETHKLLHLPPHRYAEKSLRLERDCLKPHGWLAGSGRGALQIDVHGVLHICLPMVVLHREGYGEVVCQHCRCHTSICPVYRVIVHGSAANSADEASEPVIVRLRKQSLQCLALRQIHVCHHCLQAVSVHEVGYSQLSAYLPDRQERLPCAGYAVDHSCVGDMVCPDDIRLALHSVACDAVEQLCV